MTVRTVARRARTMGYVYGFLKPFYGFLRRGMVNSQIDSELHTLDLLSGLSSSPASDGGNSFTKAGAFP